jgi:predicted transcriptional regulator
MSVLKAPPKQPKNATLQIRIDEELKAKLEKYAEFLDTTAAYVVAEALKLVFNKDAAFKQWLEKDNANGSESHTTVVKPELSIPTDSTSSNSNGNKLQFK